ncbi:MAG: OB-fold nucleic acid binding domain-containing protein [Candidatus Micrarchaeota archaeon]
MDSALKQQLVAKTAWTEQELAAKIAEKQEKFAGLLAEDAALELLARENGMDVKKPEPAPQFTPLASVEAGTTANVRVRVLHVFALKRFEKNGRKGKVCNVSIADDSCSATLVLWGRDCAAAESLERNDWVEVTDGIVKNKNPLEIHSALLTQVKRVGEAKPQVTEIKDLRDGKEADFFARLLEVGEEKEFDREKNGVKTKGKMASALAADDSGQIRLVLWDENAELARRARPGDAVKVESGAVKQGRDGSPEVHLGWRSRAILNPRAHGLREREELWKAKYAEKKIGEACEGETVLLYATLAEVSGCRLVRKCRSCGTSVNMHEQKCSCGSEDLRDLLVLEAKLSDPTGSARAVFFGREAMHVLGVNKVTIDPQTIAELKAEQLAGKPIKLIAQAKQGRVSGEKEFVAKHVL